MTLYLMLLAVVFVGCAFAAVALMAQMQGCDGEPFIFGKLDHEGKFISGTGIGLFRIGAGGSVLLFAVAAFVHALARPRGFWQIWMEVVAAIFLGIAMGASLWLFGDHMNQRGLERRVERERAASDDGSGDVGGSGAGGGEVLDPTAPTDEFIDRVERNRASLLQSVVRKVGVSTDPRRFQKFTTEELAVLDTDLRRKIAASSTPNCDCVACKYYRSLDPEALPPEVLN